MNPTGRSPDKSNYSYEEMMDKLRKERQKSSSGRVSEEGASSQPVRIEVVEDEQGNPRVAEVRRRRKRRSHQPKKIKEERIKKLRRLAVFGGIPLLALVVAGILLMFSRVGGERFRANASERVSELLGAGVEFGRFKLNGLNLNSRKALIKGAPDSLLREAELLSLRSRIKLASLISSDWDLGFVHASEGRFRFGRPGTGGAGGGGIGRSSSEGGGRRPLVKAGLGLDSAPSLIDMTGMKVTSCDLFWDGRLPASEPFVSKSGISTGELVGPTISLSFRGGKLAVPGWPEFKLAMISGDLDDSVYHIRRSNLEHLGNGRASISGTVDLGRNGDYKLRAEFEQISAREIMHPFWADHFGGTISGGVDISGSLALPGSMAASGEFSARDLVLSHKMLQRLSTEVGESLLARIVFRNFSGRFRKNADKTEFYDLEGEQDSLFKLRGRVTVYADGRLEGQLQIGILETVLEKMEGGKPVFFGVAEDGFVWAGVELAGLIDEPREDLTDKLRAGRLRFQEEGKRALPGQLTPTSPRAEGRGSSGKEGLERTFEELIKP